jgi:hypothetical protein
MADSPGANSPQPGLDPSGKPGQPPHHVVEHGHTSSWRVFRIMAEFVDGFSFLADIHNSVTFFGSARLPQGNRYYELARGLAQRLAQRGYTVVTGGGPGIMQAANQGAYEVGGNSVGLNIQLPHEQRTNPYVRHSTSFHYFFSRKVMLDFSARAYIFFPGGFGTMDEFFELITLVQTGKHERHVPIIMMGHDYWDPLTRWMREVMLGELNAINPDDLTIFSVTDDLDEAVRLIETGIQTQRQHEAATTGRTHHSADDKIRQATSPMAGTEQ